MEEKSKAWAFLKNEEACLFIDQSMREFTARQVRKALKEIYGLEHHKDYVFLRPATSEDLWTTRFDHIY